MLAADADAFPIQHVAQHACPHERVLQMQRIDAPHQRQIGHRDGLRQVVHRAAADAHQFGLPGDGKVVLAVDHFLTLNMPALMSAPSKKSFSSANWPILACSTFTSTGGSAGWLPLPSNTLADRSTN